MKIYKDKEIKISGKEMEGRRVCRKRRARGRRHGTQNQVFLTNCCLLQPPKPRLGPPRTSPAQYSPCPVVYNHRPLCHPQCSLARYPFLPPIAPSASSRPVLHNPCTIEPPPRSTFPIATSFSIPPCPLHPLPRPAPYRLGGGVQL